MTDRGTDIASRASAAANVSIRCPIAAATTLLSRPAWLFRLCRLNRRAAIMIADTTDVVVLPEVTSALRIG
ncbi:hypothetical protein GCM10009559_75570 [Pseudonocardia zijingensis]|uniref:Uncharacterized protein n=1 Tax=Pseudonocardia zijingensis TaxID=153376 RepID=A0ABP3YUT7_9PSEU